MWFKSVSSQGNKQELLVSIQNFAYMCKSFAANRIVLINLLWQELVGGWMAAMARLMFLVSGRWAMLLTLTIPNVNIFVYNVSWNSVVLYLAEPLYLLWMCFSLSRSLVLSMCAFVCMVGYYERYFIRLSCIKPWRYPVFLKNAHS